LQRFITLVSPLAPHLGEECWEILGNATSIFENPVWFTVDTKALIEDNVIIPVQVNGKLRAKVEVAINSSDEEVKKAVYADEKVKQYTDGQTVVKEIYVKNKIYNIVVK
jgi:leucyl-tRNA synthetase